MYLNPKMNNSVGYCLLPMLNIDIKLEYIVDVKKHDDNTIILVIYNTGLNSCIKYIEYLRTKSNYIKEEDNRFYFRIYDNYIKDYNNIVIGEYKNISSSYVNTYNKYFDDISNNKVYHKYIIRFARRIVNNNKITWETYWKHKLKDLDVTSINWILKLMDKNGNYYSKSNDWYITNT